MSRSCDWYLVTDVSGQRIEPTFKGQAIQLETEELLGVGGVWFLE